MNEFKQAKATIRAAVAAAPRPTVESILEAAREGRVPYWGACDFHKCGCFAQRIAQQEVDYEFDLSRAYLGLGMCHTRCRGGGIGQHDDPLRHKILIAICRADLRRRDRAMVKALVESAEPSRRELLKKAWVAPVMTLLLSASTVSARMRDWGYAGKRLKEPRR